MTGIQFTAKLTQRHKVTVPKNVVEVLGLEPGVLLTISVDSVHQAKGEIHE